MSAFPLCLCLLAVTLGNKVLLPNIKLESDDQVFVHAVPMYSVEGSPLGDKSPPGNGVPYIITNAEFQSASGAPTQGELEVVLVQVGSRLVNIEGCCRSEYLGQPGCTVPDTMWLPDEQTIRSWRMKVRFDGSGAPARLGGLNARTNVTSTGVYVLLLSNCDPRVGPVIGSFSTVWMNPYGFLPGDLYGYLPFYGVMTLVFLAVSTLWFAWSCCYWREVIPIQNHISFVLLLCLSEMLLWYFDYSNLNMTGDLHMGVMTAGIVLRSFRRSVSRLLVLSCALGYGTVVASLSAQKARLLALGAVFFVADAALESLKRYMQNANVDSSARLFLTVPVALCDALFAWWIFVALYETMARLEARRQEHKLVRFKWLSRVLIFAFVVASAFAIDEAYFVYAHSALEEWPTAWLRDAGLSTGLYATILIMIAILWRPSADSRNLAYSQLDASAIADEEEFGPLSDVELTQRHAKETEAHFSLGDDSDEDTELVGDAKTV